MVKVSNPKSQVENSKSQVQNHKSQVENPKSKIQNPKNLRFGIWVLGFRIWVLGFGLLGFLLAGCTAAESTPTPTRVPIRAQIPTPPAANGLDANLIWLFGTPTATLTPTATATAGPSPTPTLTPTPINVETLKGKLLFLSSRPLPAAYRVETSLRGLTNPDVLKAFQSSNAGVLVWRFEPATYQVLPCDPPPATPTPTRASARSTSALLFGDLGSVFQRGATACQQVYDEAQRTKTFSPDQRYEVYVGADPNGGRPQIWVIDHQAQTKKMLTRFGTGVSYDPAFAPDGYRIVFVSQEAGQDNLYTITRDGTALKRITRIAGQDWTTTWEWVKRPVWSTDGTQIAFWSNRVSGARQIWVMNADGTNLHTISGDPRPAEDWDPVWVR